MPSDEKHPASPPVESNQGNNNLPNNGTNAGEEWRVYLNNSSSLSSSWNSDQEKYAKFCHAAVNDATNLLDRENISVKDVYSFLAAKRHEIAVELNQKSNKHIGIMRSYETVGAYTPILPNGKYEDFFPEVKRRIFELYDTPAEERHNFVLREDKNKGPWRRGDWIVITDGDIELTGITKPREDQTEIYRFGSSFTFLHTDGKYIPMIYEKVDNLLSAVLEDPQPSLENMKKIGEMVWYLAHAMPCNRGSAATTEMFARLLMKKVGLPSVPYKHHIPLDFEALIEPDKNKFVERFTSSFYPELNKHYAAHVEKPMYKKIQTGFYKTGMVLFGKANKAAEAIKESVKIINKLSK